MANTKTLQDALDACYGIIAQGQDSTAYPSGLMTTFVEKAQRDVCNGNIQNRLTNERIDKQALTFLEENSFYSSVNFSTLSADAAVGGSSVSMADTSWFHSSGYLWIDGNVVQYSGNTGTSLTGIPSSGFSLKFPFKAGKQVFQLEALPDDFGQLARAFLTLNNTRVRTALVGIDDRDLATPVPNSYLYRFFYDRGYSNGSGLGQEWYYSLVRGRFVLFMVPQTAGSPISFEYQKAPSALSSSESLLTVPDDYSLTTVPYLAVSEMLANRMETEEAARLSDMGFQNVKSMYQFYSTQRTELMYGQRVRTSSDWFLNF